MFLSHWLVDNTLWDRGHYPTWQMRKLKLREVRQCGLSSKLENGRVRTETWSNSNDTHDPRIGNKFLNIFGESARCCAHFSRLACSGTVILSLTRKPRAHAIPLSCSNMAIWFLFTFGKVGYSEPLKDTTTSVLTSQHKCRKDKETTHKTKCKWPKHA